MSRLLLMYFVNVVIKHLLYFWWKRLYSLLWLSSFFLSQNPFELQEQRAELTAKALIPMLMTFEILLPLLNFTLFLPILISWQPWEVSIWRYRYTHTAKHKRNVTQCDLVGLYSCWHCWGLGGWIWRYSNLLPFLLTGNNIFHSGPLSGLVSFQE